MFIQYLQNQIQKQCRVSEPASSPEGQLCDAEQKAREAVQASFNEASQAGGDAEPSNIPQSDSRIRMDRNPSSYRLANEAEHDLKTRSNVHDWMKETQI